MQIDHNTSINHFNNTEFDSHHGGSARLATIYLTNKCNLNCAYCYAIENKFDHADRWEMDQIKETLSILNTMGYRISVGGGEPLLEKELLFEIIREARRLSMGISLLTNGYLLDDNVLKNLADCGLDWAQISSDKVDELQYFSKILKTGKEMGIKMAIGTVLAKSNISSIESFIDKLIKSRVHAWRILRYTPLNRKTIEYNYPTNKEWIEFLLILEKVIRNKKPAFQVRYEPSIIPFSWLKKQPKDNMFDICGGRTGRRLFLYPNGKVYACGLPRLNGIYLGNCVKNPSGLSDKLIKLLADDHSENSFDTIDEYCNNLCRGGCLQMKKNDSCDPRCDLGQELVPVCCFEKFQISYDGNNDSKNVYPSDLYGSWLIN